MPGTSRRGPPPTRPSRPGSTCARCAVTPPGSPNAGSRRPRSPAGWPRCAPCSGCRWSSAPARTTRPSCSAPRSGPSACPECSSPLELRDRALFELAYACGLRAEEIVSLDVESLDFDSEAVRVEGKGGKTRLVPVGEHALAALTRYMERARPALRNEAARGD